MTEVVVEGPTWGGQLPNSSEWTVWYFGSDYGRFLALSAAVGSAAMAPVGQSLNAVAERLRADMIELDRYLARWPRSLAWLASDIAERNPSTSEFRIESYRSIALLESIRAGGQHFVVVDDEGFGRALVDVIRRAGYSARWRGGRSSTLRFLRGVARAHAIFVRDWLREKRAIAKNTMDVDALAGTAPWLMSWADRQPVNSNGEERFFGVLPVWLREAGLRIGWLGNPATWLGSYDEIASGAAATREPVVLVGRFYGLCALLGALLAFMRFPFALHRDLCLSGVSLKPLVNRAVACELTSNRLATAAMYAGVARQLKRMGVVPRALFYTYENQPWEKALIFGFRRHLPTTRLIGVQHAPVALVEQYMSGLPSRGQWRDDIMPDRLLTIGPEVRDQLIALGAPPDRVEVGGALRFRSILSETLRTPAEPKPTPVVLATCSMHYNESFELAHKAVVATAKLKSVELLVNFHPMVDPGFQDEIRERISRLMDCSHVRFVSGGAQTWLAQADLLLYTSSSTVFEAAAMGVPSIFVGSDIALHVDVMSGHGASDFNASERLDDRIGRLLTDAALRRRSVAEARWFLQRCYSTPERDFWVALTQQNITASAA